MGSIGPGRRTRDGSEGSIHHSGNGQRSRAFVQLYYPLNRIGEGGIVNEHHKHRGQKKKGKESKAAAKPAAKAVLHCAIQIVIVLAWYTTAAHKISTIIV
eukprot:scaffold1808_cov360-Prasinococcus_capsulatus_cf.AAC.14